MSCTSEAGSESASSPASAGSRAVAGVTVTGDRADQPFRCPRAEPGHVFPNISKQNQKAGLQKSSIPPQKTPPLNGLFCHLGLRGKEKGTWWFWRLRKKSNLRQSCDNCFRINSLLLALVRKDVGQQREPYLWHPWVTSCLDCHPSHPRSAQED